MSWLDRTFRLHERRTTVAREVRGGVATFLTMAYILFANAGILGSTGMPQDSIVACTALAAGICCIAMGLYANFPIALASGMGLNAVIAYQVTQVTGSWQTAMGLIVLDGLIVLILVLSGLREAIMHAIPRDLRLAIGSGIGLFIAFIGLVNAGLVQASGVPSAPLMAGDVTQPATLIALGGLLLTAILMARRVTGAIIIGIIVCTLAAVAMNVTQFTAGFARPSFAVAFEADVWGALRLQFLPLLFAVIMVDFFDTLGSATAIAEQADLLDANGRIPGLKRLLIVDSASASVGGLLGVSSVTCYIESAAGVAEGARTGLHTVVVGVLFLLAIFAAPLADVVPPAATAPALILVGFLMIGQIAGIKFDDLETAIPAFIILLTVPFTFSISHGIGYGFIAFVVIKVVSLKPHHVHPLMYLTSIAFLLWFAGAPVARWLGW